MRYSSFAQQASIPNAPGVINEPTHSGHLPETPPKHGTDENPHVFGGDTATGRLISSKHRIPKQKTATPVINGLRDRKKAQRIPADKLKSDSKNNIGK
ncbi:MAG: hypothetical protein ACXVC9_11520 [Bacteroidia bacterium]